MRHYVRHSSRPGHLSLETIEEDGSILMVERHTIPSIMARLAQIETFARLVGQVPQIDGLDSIVTMQAEEQAQQLAELFS